MIARLLEIKSAINATTPIDSQLREADWKNLKEIMEVLKPFKSAQKILEGDKYVTASLVAEAVKFIVGGFPGWPVFWNPLRTRGWISLFWMTLKSAGKEQMIPHGATLFSMVLAIIRREFIRPSWLQHS
jgi:hypothetical protein